MNPDSNYRKYYLNDPSFYLRVIEQEEAPFEFKIHVFQNAKYNTSEQPVIFGKEIEL
jgi:hypothetical protein